MDDKRSRPSVSEESQISVVQCKSLKKTRVKKTGIVNDDGGWEQFHNDIHISHYQSGVDEIQKELRFKHPDGRWETIVDGDRQEWAFEEFKDERQ
ncbi:unnamed protein product [Echinostoma caproni]|uniref:4a-hydroxytetrahydrobiopterin dehydratase n=1 Tax=Echinostoma caproni TaxID=27848 RepID=A0A183ACD5_9TREM|nr:unnamed protein product [Echinostoma caproni]